jgi:hypothetical protein
MSDLASDIAAYKAALKEMRSLPNLRKWVKGANGLWSSYDPVIQAQQERKAKKAAKEAARAEAKKAKAEAA